MRDSIGVLSICNIAVCGNSAVEGIEQCDDGNTADGDGCSGDCLLKEDGYGCPNPGSLCILCDVTCKTCSGTSETECTECYAGMNLEVSNSTCYCDPGTFWSVNTCVSSCPAGEGGNPVTLQCEPCESNCDACSDYLTCTTCTPTDW